MTGDGLTRYDERPETGHRKRLPADGGHVQKIVSRFTLLRRILWGGALSILFLAMSGLVHGQEATPTPGAPAMATVDRLAAPPTVPSPDQADEGAQLFWLHCQPCHGDQGQGLTDEWRAQFPEEEQYCWQSGCHGEHGKDPPETGFVLPTAVPAVIGQGSLEKFADAHQLFAYIRGAMPYEAPGRLTDEEYLAITAYLARAHGAWDGVTLNESNVVQLRLAPDEAFHEAVAAEIDLSSVSTPMAAGQDQPAQPETGRSPAFFLLTTVLILATFLAGGAWLWHRRRQ